MRIEQIRLWGVRICKLTLEEALSLAEKRENTPLTVFTPNALMLEAARRDEGLRALLNYATLSLPDGRGVLWAAARKGTPLSARVAGIDFGTALLQAAAEQGLRVFLLGGAPGVADAAAEQLIGRLPSLCICGTHHGYFGEGAEETRELLSLIQAASPHILLVCMGFPRQEMWVREHLSHLPSVEICACLGGSLDVWADRIKRAPLLLQKAGLEWAFRMVCEPKRMLQLPHLADFFWHSVVKRPK